MCLIGTKHACRRGARVVACRCCGSMCAVAVAVGTPMTDPVAITDRVAAVVRAASPALMPPSALEYAYVVARSPAGSLAGAPACANISPRSRAAGPGSSTRGERGLRPSAKRKGLLFKT